MNALEQAQRLVASLSRRVVVLQAGECPRGADLTDGRMIPWDLGALGLQRVLD